MVHHPRTVDVPCPSSSRMTREEGVAALRMADVSLHNGAASSLGEGGEGGG